MNAFINDEDILNIRDLLEWMGKLFKDGPEPEAIQKLRTGKEAKSMLSALAERMETKYKLEGKPEIARSMHADGLTMEQIMKYTGLSRAVILAGLEPKID